MTPKNHRIFKILSFSLFFLGLTMCFAIPVYSSDPEDVNIIDVPYQIGKRLGVPAPNTAFVGGILMTAIVLLAFTLPTMLLRNKAPAMIMIFLVLCLSVAVEWIPVWILLMVVLLVVAMGTYRLKRMFS